MTIKPNQAAGYKLQAGRSDLFALCRKNARMAAMTLTDGTVCLISPLNGMQSVAPPAAAVSHLVAPNHYHHKGLAAFHAAHPRAQLCAPSAARPRLEKLTGLKIKTLTALARKLPAGISLLEPAGLKTGEMWIRFKTGTTIGWFVTDAFCGKTMSGSVQQCNTPLLLGTFPSFGIADRLLYKDWLLSQIEHDKPKLIIPCHGSVITAPNLPAKLVKLIAPL